MTVVELSRNNVKVAFKRKLFNKILRKMLTVYQQRKLLTRKKQKNKKIKHSQEQANKEVLTEELMETLSFMDKIRLIS